MLCREGVRPPPLGWVVRQHRNVNRRIEMEIPRGVRNVLYLAKPIRRLVESYPEGHVHEIERNVGRRHDVERALVLYEEPGTDGVEFVGAVGRRPPEVGNVVEKLVWQSHLHFSWAIRLARF